MIYIDHDLSFDERQRQSDIYNWVKEKRKNGAEVKVGLGKVWMNDMWIKWEEIVENEKAEKRRREREKMRESRTENWNESVENDDKEKKEDEQNF